MLLHIFIYQYMKYWVSVVYFFFNNLIFGSQTIKRVVDSPETILYNRELVRFTKYIETDLYEKNQNIDVFFYDKVKYKAIFENVENDYEAIWKRKILYMTTPMGNIAMYYDPYKLGFSYYSDQSYIKYDILNAVAMKYVIIFRCFDFFMDERITKIPSPLIKIHLIEEKKIDASKPNYNAIQVAKTDKSPFVKFRKPIVSTILQNNKGTTVSTKKENSTFLSREPLPPILEKNFNRNKFIYLGKMHNCQFIIPVPKLKKQFVNYKSDLLDGLEKNASVQSECLSYRDYIKMRSTKFI